MSAQNSDFRYNNLLDARGLKSGDLAPLDFGKRDARARAVASSKPAAAALRTSSNVASPMLNAAAEDENDVSTPATFSDLDEDVLLEIFKHLDDPLRPSVAAITALNRDTRAFPRLRKAANSLRSRRDGARRLCHRMDTTLDRLATAGRLAWAKRSLTDDDIGALAALSLPRLVEVDLRYNLIGDAGLVALAAASAAGRLPQLTNLALSNNKITDAGLESLAAMTDMASVESYNDDGVWPRVFEDLEVLSLMFNKINQAGMAAIALALGTHLAMPNLRSVMLAGNLCDDSVVKQALQHTCARLGDDASRTVTLGLGCGPGTSMSVPKRSLLLRPMLANEVDGPEVTIAPWNVHGPGVDVATSLASSYADGTLLGCAPSLAPLHCLASCPHATLHRRPRQHCLYDAHVRKDSNAAPAGRSRPS